MRRRIAITQRVTDLPERNERRDALDQAWSNIADALDADLYPIPNRSRPESLAAIDCDLIVLSGGNDISALPDPVEPAPERDATETTLLRVAADREIPLLGVCRGLQFMVHTAGGRLMRVADHRAQPHAISIAINAYGLVPATQTVNSFHTWGISPDGVPAPYLVAARASDGTAEAIVHPDLPHVGVMWHPERGAPAETDLAMIAALMEGTR